MFARVVLFWVLCVYVEVNQRTEFWVILSLTPQDPWMVSRSDICHFLIRSSPPASAASCISSGSDEVFAIGTNTCSQSGFEGVGSLTSFELWLPVNFLKLALIKLSKPVQIQKCIPLVSNRTFKFYLNIHTALWQIITVIGIYSTLV